MRRITKARWFLIALAPIALAFLASACSDDTTTNPTTNVGDTARGRYLVQYVGGCIECHTPHDQQTGAPIVSKTLAGGERFDLGPLGAVYSRNLTSDSATGIGAMTDEEIIAAIRTGVAKHHHNGMTMTDTLIVMPYQNLAYLTDADVKAVVAYLRTLAPISNQVPEDTVNLALIGLTTRPLLTKQAGYPDPKPNNATTTHGQYLVQIASCNDCHTPNPTGLNPDMTKFLSGGDTLAVGPFYNISANLTPDTATGLGSWRDSQIDSVFVYGIDDDGENICPPMPWQLYKNMTQSDRAAIIAYLRGIPAVSNKVGDKTIQCP